MLLTQLTEFPSGPQIAYSLGSGWVWTESSPSISNHVLTQCEAIQEADGR